MQLSRQAGRWALVGVVGCFGILAHGQTSIDFDTYPDGAPVPTGRTVSHQWADLGVIFSDPSGAPAYATGSHCSQSAPNHVGGTVVARFIDPVSGSPALTRWAGVAQDLCWASGEGIRMRAYGAQGELLATLFNDQGPGAYMEFRYEEPRIARIEMEGVGQGIDDFLFETPVVIDPGTCRVPAGTTQLPGGGWSTSKPTQYVFTLAFEPPSVDWTGRKFVEEISHVSDTCTGRTGVPTVRRGGRVRADGVAYDGVGFRPEAVTRFRNAGRVPCAETVTQRLLMRCPDGSLVPFGPAVALRSGATATEVSAERAGEVKTQVWP